MYNNRDSIIFIDGDFSNVGKTRVDIFSQTLHYGYGVFEGIRSYGYEEQPIIFKAEDHYQRLKDSCKLVGIPFDYTVKDLVEITYQLLLHNRLKNAYIRPLVYCSANMGLTKAESASLMISAWEWGAYLGSSLLNVKISTFCRPHPRSISIEAKVCGHYVNSILATIEAKNEGYDEALLLDSNGYVAEGSGANIFFENEGKLYTPQLGNILPGITRATVLEICKALQIEVKEGLYKPSELLKADSAFFCGTATEIAGIRSVENIEMPLDWKSSLGYKIQKEYQKLVQRNDTIKQIQ